jgi:antitoxin component YwqK of YwqJK toxin-antitoxin module
VGNCISGQREGLYREYYETGVIKGEWSFREGKKEGIAREYFESGEIKYLDTYRRDQRVNRKAYLEYEGHEKSTQELNDVKEIKEILISQTESYVHYQNQILERIRLLEKRIKELEAVIGDLSANLKSTTA